MWDKASGERKVNSVEKAMRTRVQRKLLLGARKCCVCVWGRWQQSDLRHPRTAGTQNQANHKMHV